MKHLEPSHLPMNLFFSSLAMWVAKARPIPEEHPVIRTVFWLIVPSWRRTEAGVIAIEPTGFSSNQVLNPLVCNSAEASSTWIEDYQCAHTHIHLHNFVIRIMASHVGFIQRQTCSQIGSMTQRQ